MVGTKPERPDLDPSTDSLWQRIDAFELVDLEAEPSFADRLARENGWKPVYARRVIDEYKRFCYLAIRADHPVTPSDQVDQVWLLHLSYSHDYRDEFCTKALRTDLHHEPMRGGADEAGEIVESYEATLASYERISGERPPADIWPDPPRRFADVDDMRRVNTADYFVIRRPPQGIVWVVQLATIFAVLVSAWNGAMTAAFAFGAIAAALYIYRVRTDNRVLRRPWRDGDDDNSGGGD